MEARRELTYDPIQDYEVRTRDVVYLREEDTEWMATVYQPQGTGPFPALLDVHGGVWSGGSRSASALVDQALAASGVVVVAVDFGVAPEYPYPAQVVATNFATRWLKAHASDFNTDPHTVGGMGMSSGGHTVMLSAMRPHDPQYAALSLPEAPDLDATLAYLLLRYPVLDPYARYLYAKETGRDALVKATEGYFLTEAAMQEANPELILERGEQVQLPPTLIVQGTADANIPNSIPERFVVAYRAASGSVDLEWFPDTTHVFDIQPGPDTARALGLLKAFISKQLASASAMA